VVLMVAQLRTAPDRWPSAAAAHCSSRVSLRYQTLGGRGLLAGLACYVLSLGITLLVAAPDDAFELSVYLSALFLAFAFVLSRQPADDLLRPFVWLTALYVAYTVGGVFFMKTNPQNQVSRESEWIFAATSLLGLLAMHVGHAQGLRTVPCYSARPAAIRRVTDPRCFEILCLSTAGLAAYPGRTWVADRFSPSRIAAYTDWASSRRAEALLDPQSGLGAYCGELCIFLLLIALLAPLFYGWKLRWLTVAVGLALVLLTIKGGHKSYALFFFSALAVWWNYQRSRLRGWHLLVGGLAAYVALAAFNHVRYTSSLSEMGRASVDMIRQDPTLLTPAKGGELSSAVREYLILLDGIQIGTAEITYGGTLLRDLGAFVPKALWPDRPLPASEYYMQSFYPKEFDEGKGLGLYIVAEAYWNFGFLGVAAEMAFVGWFCNWMYAKIEPSASEPLRPLLYAFALQIFVIPVVRGGFILCTKTGLMFVGPVLLLFALSTRQPARIGASAKNRLPGSNPQFCQSS
jgi:predicted membrane channel-forming protein YqfA (hemolysin III family)